MVMRFCLSVIAAFLIAADPAKADVFMFQTPSGNIQCSVGLEVDFADVQCMIVERSGPAALPRPNSCGAFWGHSFALGETGPVQMICSLQPQRVEINEQAAYGETGTFGAITCLSQRSGFTCTNANGHGFFLSRRQQTVF